MATEVKETTEQGIKLGNIKQGDLMLVAHYVKVDRIFRGFVDHHKLEVTNLDTGMEFNIQGKSLIEKCQSADQFFQEVKESRTAIATLLTQSYNKPLTVCFDKLNGDTRVLRGRLIKPEAILGRSMVEDLDIRKGNKMRLVDHRTIQYLIVDGIKHTVK